VIWILDFAGQLGPVEIVNRICRADVGVEVDSRTTEAVDITSPPTALVGRQREITKPVVKRAVLEHQHDDVIDRVQPQGGLVTRSCDQPRRHRRDRSCDQPRRHRRDRSVEQLDNPAPFRRQQMRDVSQRRALDVIEESIHRLPPF
jgi:hypothetical protein